MARKTKGGSDPRANNRDELLWLETYFIVFPHKRRPTLAQVEHVLAEADPRLQLENLAADEDGLFQSLLVESPEDHAAVEISYETGDSVVEQNLEWAKQLQDRLSPKQLQQFVSADARLDVAHFERVPKGASPPSGKLSAPAGPRLHNADDAETNGAIDDDFDYGSVGDAEDDFDDEAALEIFDPTCLLTVVDALSSLTKGLTFDPAAGEVV